MRISKIAFSLLILSLSACHFTTSKPLTENDKVALQSGSNAWLQAARASDWQALAAAYAPDAALLPPNQPIVSGRENIKNWFTTLPPIKAFNINLLEIEGRDDLAYIRGTYTLTLAPKPDQTLTETGKFLEIHRKNADGSWSLTRDMFSADNPLTKQLTN